MFILGVGDTPGWGPQRKQAQRDPAEETGALKGCSDIEAVRSTAYNLNERDLPAAGFYRPTFGVVGS